MSLKFASLHNRSLRKNISMCFMAIGLISAVALLTGCEVSKSEVTDSGNGNGNGGGGGGGGEALTFEVTATADNANYSILVSKDGDGVTPCAPTSDDKEITCIVDMEELDLFFHGLTITATAPHSVCKYMGSRPQFYSVAPVGYQPTDVFYALDSSGAFDDPTTHAGLTPAGLAATDPDIYYKIDGDWVSHEDLYGDAATAPEDLRCPYDYSEVSTFSAGENCCYIEYNKMVDNDGEAENSREDWGGALSNCYRGAGIQDWDKTNGNGFPVELIEEVDAADGLTSTFTITAPIADDELEEQVSVANYFSGGTAPRALSDGNPYYWYKCYDANREIQYQVNVLVREWNTGGERVDGDPDVTGSESAPFSDAGKNDFQDWDDITDALSGYNLASFALVPATIDDYLFNVTPGATANERWLGFAP